MIYVILHEMAINEDLAAILQACDVFISILRHTSLREERTSNLWCGRRIEAQKKLVNGGAVPVPCSQDGLAGLQQFECV